MKIYLFPGLGFDNRIFSKLNLEGLNIEFIDWTEPKKGENFQEYAKRTFDEIDWSNKKIILIGHSLGGLLCQELAAINNVEKIILISSIKSRNELPFHFRIVQPLKLHKLFTKKMTFTTLPFWAEQHDYESAEDKALFKSMVGKHSDYYLQWALKELSAWQQPKILSKNKVIQIHGNKDKTFPIKLINKPDYVIEDARHFMVYKRAEEIGQIIRKEIKSTYAKPDFQ